MKLKQIKFERGQIQLGACCDKTNGPAAAQLTVQDEETGRKYYCVWSEYDGKAECLVARRDVLQSVCNLYDEDVIPWQLEKYRMSEEEERSRAEASAFAGCFRYLEQNLR